MLDRLALAVGRAGGADTLSGLIGGFSIHARPVHRGRRPLHFPLQGVRARNDILRPALDLDPVLAGGFGKNHHQELIERRAAVGQNLGELAAARGRDADQDLDAFLLGDELEVFSGAGVDDVCVRFAAANRALDHRAAGRQGPAGRQSRGGPLGRSRPCENDG